MRGEWSYQNCCGPHKAARIQSRSTIIDDMSSTTFNTLAVSKNLQKAGMDAALAEDVAEEIEACQSELATKSDIQSVRNDFKWLKWEIGTSSHGIQFKRSAELIALFSVFFTWL